MNRCFGDIDKLDNISDELLSKYNEDIEYMKKVDINMISLVKYIRYIIESDKSEYTIKKEKKNDMLCICNGGLSNENIIYVRREMRFHLLYTITKNNKSLKIYNTTLHMIEKHKSFGIGNLRVEPKDILDFFDLLIII